MRDLYLCGAGNVEGIRLALTLQRLETWRKVIVLDDDPAKIGTSVLGVEVVGPLSVLADAEREQDSVVNLVTRKTASRWAVMEKIEAYGVPFATLVHPSVDRFGTTLHEGVTVYQGVILGAGCTLARGSVALVRSIVGHGAFVGAGSVIAPGAVLNARVTLDERVYVGANAVLLPDLHIGADATVAALSSVLEDVPPKATAVGVPATIISMATPEASLAEGDVDTDLARSLMQVWRDVLGVAVKPTDNFFDLGGTSLQVFKVCRRASALGLRVSPTDMFRFLTVAALVAHLEPKAGPPNALKDVSQERRVPRSLRSKHRVR